MSGLPGLAGEAGLCWPAGQTGWLAWMDWLRWLARLAGLSGLGGCLGYLVWLAAHEGAGTVMAPNVDVAPIQPLDDHRGPHLFQAQGKQSTRIGFIKMSIFCQLGHASTRLELHTRLVGKGRHIPARSGRGVGAEAAHVMVWAAAAAACGCVRLRPADDLRWMACVGARAGQTELGAFGCGVMTPPRE